MLIDRERGSVTAELAVAMPTVVLLLAVILGGFGLQIERLKLVSIASSSARALGRGEPESAVNALFAEVEPVGVIRFDYLEDFACAEVSRKFEIAGLQSFEVTERQCARKGGL